MLVASLFAIQKTMANEPQKISPQNIEAEKSLLGSLMLDKNAIIKVIDFLKPKDFYKDQHKKIYEAVISLFEKGEPVDFLSASTKLKETGNLKEAGGTSYLTELINNVPTAAHVLSYAKTVQKKRLLRDLIEAGQEIHAMGYNEETDVDLLLDQAEQKVFNIAQKSMSQNFLPVKSMLEETFERIDKLSKFDGEMRGVPTGFIGLDNKLSGLQKSDLVVLAARPSLGKSSLALNIAFNAAIASKTPIGIFSLEMSKDQIIDRLISSISNIDLWKIRTGNNLSSEDFERIQHALGLLSEAPIYIDDASSSNIIQMRAMCRRLQAEYGLGLVIVDYLQLMEPRNPSAGIVQQTTEISKSLKGLARELNVPVLALSQLSRAVEQRVPSIPRLSDLRESGCLTGDTLITRADTGERIPIKELVGKKDIPVHSLNENWQIEERKISQVFTSGRKRVYEIVTQDGRRIKASANHPFWRADGWTRLDELKTGDEIATPGIMEISRPKNELSDNEIISLARKCDKETTIPRAVFTLDNEKLSLFFKHLETDKHISASEEKAESIKHLLLRLGIRSKTVSFKNGYQTITEAPGYQSLSFDKIDSGNTALITKLKTSKIFWDKIISIKELGVEKVYDATVPGLHNFVANDIIVENSIEQDSDVVLFIYRERREMEERGKGQESKIILAKHRNGPTGNIDLFFDEQCASFRNLDKTGRDEYMTN